MGALFICSCAGVSSKHRRWFIRARLCRATDARSARAEGPVHSTHHHQMTRGSPLGSPSSFAGRVELLPMVPLIISAASPIPWQLRLLKGYRTFNQDCRASLLLPPIDQVQFHPSPPANERAPLWRPFYLPVCRGEFEAPKVVHPSTALPCDRRAQREGRRPESIPPITTKRKGGSYWLPP